MSAHHSDGSITLDPNPWNTAATWADYNWRKLAATEDRILIRFILLAIADAVDEPQTDVPDVSGPFREAGGDGYRHDGEAK